MIIAPEPTEPPGPAAERPTFSIVIPVYEGAWCIGDALRSVLEQHPAADEVIVVDDGSTDALDEALAPFAGRFTLLRQEHRGVAAARNLGLSHATGEFVAVCDSDDWYLPGLIEAWSTLASGRPDIDILGRTSYLIKDGATIGLSRTPDDPPFDIDDQRLSILRANFVGGCAAFRRRHLIDLGGYDESLLCATDYESFIRMILAGSRVAMNFEPLAAIRLRDDSLSHRGTNALEGLVATFAKVLRRTDLTRPEREQATRRLREYTLALDVLRAKEAVAHRGPDARAMCLQVARNADQPAMTRAKCALSAFLPSVAGFVKGEDRPNVEATTEVWSSPARGGINSPGSTLADGAPRPL